MTDINLSGNLLRFTRGLKIADSTGVTWSFDPATNKITLAITAGAVGSFDEAAQDAVGGILTDTATVNFTYNDAGNQITADIIASGVLTALTAVDGSGSGLDADLLDGHDSTYFAAAASIPVGAAPTASVGLTAVNGSATTWMRSDGAPALDQSIAPTWSGQHTFSLSVYGPAGAVGTPAFSFSGDTNTGFYSTGADSIGAAVGGVLALKIQSQTAIVGDGSTTSTFAINGAAGSTRDLIWYTNGSNRWIIRATTTAEAGANAGSDFQIVRRADDGTSIATCLNIKRSTGAWSLGDATNNPTFTFLGTGILTAGGVYQGPAGAVGAPSFSFSGDTNTGIYSVGADQLGVATGGVLRLVFETDGRIYGKALHNNAGAVTGATNQYIASGTYTPTLTNTTNVAASTARQCSWIRVGNVVTVSGQLDVDVTSAAATLIGISLPIASALTTAFQLGGVGAAPLTNMEAAAIDGDATNDRAQMRWVAVNTANHTMAFTFTYEVL